MFASALTQASHQFFYCEDDAKKFARYSNYVQPDGYHGTRKERKIKIQKEFEDHLRNVSLRSDDVASVLKVRLL
jgi:hypothetical protein